MIDYFKMSTIRFVNLDYWISSIAFVTLVLGSSQQSYSQTQIEIKEEVPIYKNNIKASTFAFPFYGAIVSMGYERILTKHSSVELVSYYHYFMDEMSLDYHRICIMPAYKYYTVSDLKLLNDFWFSIYLSYMYETHNHNDNDSKKDIRHSLFHYGLGGSIGRRLYFHENRRAFFDIGFGVSYNYYSDKSLFSTIDWWNDKILYRPIIQFGWKF